MDSGQELTVWVSTDKVFIFKRLDQKVLTIIKLNNQILELNTDEVHHWVYNVTHMEVIFLIT